MPDDNSRRMLMPAEVARITGVNRLTVAKWADQGALPSVRTKGGHRRYRASDVRAFLARPRPRPETPSRYAPRASARIRFGTKSAAALCGTPEAAPGTPGEAAVILGQNTAGGDIILAASSLEWLDDLESAIQAARARFVIAARDRA
jgi:excisionase family DNA binding protein